MREPEMVSSQHTVCNGLLRAGHYLVIAGGTILAGGFDP